MGAIAPPEPRNDWCAHIGAKLLSCRQELGQSQRAVASEIEISYSHFCDLENGKHAPSAHMLWRLSEFFQVDPGWWYEGYEGE